MKKFFALAASVLIIGTAAQAQDVYKQQGGERNIEFLFTPLGGSPIGINGIKYRQFNSATSALRAEVFLGFNSNTETMIAEDGETEVDMVETEFSISVAPGIEKHFAGTDRLSPYIGGVLLLSYDRSATTDEFLVGEDVEESTTRNGAFTAGVNGVCGVDFYFADNIYLGGELGFGIQFRTEFDTVTESSVEGVDDVETPNGNSFGVGPNVVGAIRAGFLF